jgi:hypothetical protein
MVAGFQHHLPGRAEGQQHRLLQQRLAALHHGQPVGCDPHYGAALVEAVQAGLLGQQHAR